MSFYTEAADAALAIIREYGTTFDVRRVAKVYNETLGEVEDEYKEGGTLVGLLLPIASTPKGIFTEADNKLLEDLITGKLRFVLAAAKGAQFEPEANDLIVIAGQQFTVKGCTPLAPIGIPILYKIAVEISPASPTSANSLDVAETEAAAEALDTLVDETLPAQQ